jgi:putative peptidoglycan lipid II flippase
MVNMSNNTEVPHAVLQTSPPLAPSLPPRHSTPNYSIGVYCSQGCMGLGESKRRSRSRTGRDGGYWRGPARCPIQSRPTDRGSGDLSERPVAKTAGVVMLLIMLSRLLGFVRERAIAEVFGMDWRTDVFRAAFNIPDLMFFLLVAGGLNAAFIPVFTAYLARDEEEEGWRMAWTFFALGIGLLALMTIAGMVFTPALAPLVAVGFGGEQKMLLITLMRVMFPAVAFTALAGLGMGIHKSYKSFGAPLWGPIAYNLMIIIGTYTLGRRLGIMGMAIGTVVGAVSNFLIQLPFFVRKASPHPFFFDIHHPGIKRAFHLMGPAVVSSSITQLNFTIITSLASSLQEGSISALRTANTLVQLPLGVFAMGVSMVILPTLSSLMARDEMKAFRNTFSHGLRLVLFLTIPAAVGLVVMREPLIRLLFQVGEFGAKDTAMAARAVLFYAPGLVSQSAIQILVQVYYSLQDTKTLVRVSAQAIVINTLLGLLFIRFTSLGHGGLALAYSLTSMWNMVSYLRGLRRAIGSIDGRRLLRSATLALVASVAMGLTAKAATTIAASYGGRLMEVAIGVSAGVLVYMVMAFALRMEEISLLKQALSAGRTARPARD